MKPLHIAYWSTFSLTTEYAAKQSPRSHDIRSHTHALVWERMSLPTPDRLRHVALWRADRSEEQSDVCALQSTRFSYHRTSASHNAAISTDHIHCTFSSIGSREPLYRSNFSDAPT